MSEYKEGRELDALVAEKVMGWKLVHWSWEDGSWTRNSAWPPHLIAELDAAHPYAKPGWIREGDMPDVRFLSANLDYRSYDLPRYSSDIGDAWKVVEKMESEGWGHKHLVHSASASLPGVVWAFMQSGKGAVSISSAEAATAPLAICLAALKAVSAGETKEGSA